MRQLIALSFVLVLLMMSGCATSPELIRTAGISARDDVFAELTDGGPIPQGYADLRIVSSLKTHMPGIFGRGENAHGAPDYKLLVNIDGQSTEIAGILQVENIARGLRDPEAGEGIRYDFRKDVRLKAGTHRIIVALPEDEVAVERELTLKDGSVNELVLEPVYGFAKPRRLSTGYTQTGFRAGINMLKVLLNGKPLQAD